MNWHAKPLTKREIEVSSWACPALGGAMPGHRQLCAPGEPLGAGRHPVIFLRLWPHGSSQASRVLDFLCGLGLEQGTPGQGAEGHLPT